MPRVPLRVPVPVLQAPPAMFVPDLPLARETALDSPAAPRETPTDFLQGLHVTLPDAFPGILGDSPRAGYVEILAEAKAWVEALLSQPYYVGPAQIEILDAAIGYWLEPDGIDDVLFSLALMCCVRELYGPLAQQSLPPVPVPGQKVPLLSGQYTAVVDYSWGDVKVAESLLGGAPVFGDERLCWYILVARARLGIAKEPFGEATSVGGLGEDTLSSQQSKFVPYGPWQNRRWGILALLWSECSECGADGSPLPVYAGTTLQA